MPTNQTPIRQFYAELTAQAPDLSVWDDYPRRFAFGTDASFYRLIPELVVQAQHEDHLILLVTLSQQFNVALTFRAAGTSLSGQAITDSVLVMLGSDWNQITIEPDGSIVHLKPGVIGAHANQALAPYGRKIGPDPASINTCKIGGIAANNASGMCCGTQSNSYQTLAGIRLVLADGSLLDTRSPESVAQFESSHAELLSRLDQLAKDVKANQELSDRIRHKYRIKNTTGYSLNALVDFENPIDILAHLMIGSEGTLGFISEISYQTVIDEAYKAADLISFADIETCCKAVEALSEQPVAAVELVDSAGLKTALSNPGVASLVGDMPEGAAAILVDVRAGSDVELQDRIQLVDACLQSFKTIRRSGFSSDSVLYEQLWSFRKGLFPAVGAVRDNGTTVIIEDVAFPIESLAQGVIQLQQCFDKHGYSDALIFGHALEGNLHFVFSQAFSTPEAVQKYDGFMQEIGELVAVKFGGSLKAEHGTGRNMAPFVELEWGSDAYQVMQSIKQILDPENRLNPGVILNDDPNVHLKNLKGMAETDDIVDKCIECGFCEPACPSRNLTYTPRQRIAMLREIKRLEVSEPESELLPQLQKDYYTLGLDSCAATGMCAERCPVGINTGELIKRQRETQNKKYHKRAEWAESHIRGIVKSTRIGLKATQLSHDIFGTSIISATSKALTKISGGNIPLWTEAMPRAASKPKVQTPDVYDFVYWPSCVSQVMGPAKKDPQQKTQAQVIALLAERAGLNMLVPPGLESFCCGQPFASKGFPKQAEQSKNKLIEHLSQYAKPGVPVVSDTSPCAYRTLTDGLEMLDSIQFISEYLLPRLSIKPINRRISLHVPCTAKRNKQTSMAVNIVKSCANNVVIPTDIECCGFAGDKGFTQPELNKSALSTLKQQVDDCEQGYSSSRTCEIGLSTHSGISYQSLLYLVEEASRIQGHQ